jgi:hypothetical protein
VTRLTQAWQVILTFKVTDEGAILPMCCKEIVFCRGCGGLDAVIDAQRPRAAIGVLLIVSQRHFSCLGLCIS